VLKKILQVDPMRHGGVIGVNNFLNRGCSVGVVPSCCDAGPDSASPLAKPSRRIGIDIP